MAVPTLITDLSTTISSNSPAGSESVFPNLDDYMRATSGFIASIRDNSGNGWVSPYATLASPSFTGTMSVVNLTASGTLTMNGTIAGTGLTNYLAAPGAIGTTTPAGGRFTFAYTAPAAVTFSATAMAVDCSLSNVFTTTFTANVTTAPTFSNVKDGQTINWFITQDATGSRTMTWPTSFKWPGGAAGVLSTAANSVDLLVITYRSSTGFWYATLSKGFA